MSNYQSNYTGAQIDSAISAVNTAVNAGGIVNINGLNTTLAGYIPSNSPENTSHFLRGDNTWSNTLNGGYFKVTGNQSTLYISDTSTDIDTWSMLVFGHSTNTLGAYIFLNGPSRVNEGGANLLTIRNNVGDVAIDNNVNINGLLQITNSTNTVTIGSQNNGWCHIYNGQAWPFIFNQSVTTTKADGTLGTNTYPFHQLILGGATDATMTSASTNPRITFQEGNSAGQPVHIIYTDYDSYRSPAGLKVVGGANASPAWFEVEGTVYAKGYGNTVNATGSTHSAGLKAYFDSNYSTHPRNVMSVFYSSAYGNGSLCMGYFLAGYNQTNAYGGFFVSRYNTAEYVGVQNGTYTDYVLTKTSSSSKLIKENIAPIRDKEAQQLLNITPVSFDYKKEYGEKNQYGFIAEELYEKFPYPVVYKEKDLSKLKDNPTSIQIDYIKFIPHMIKLLQLQENRIKELENKLETK